MGLTSNEKVPELREKIARFISELKDWDGARQYIKGGWLHKADQILDLTKGYRRVIE